MKIREVINPAHWNENHLRSVPLDVQEKGKEIKVGQVHNLLNAMDELKELYEKNTVHVRGDFWSNIKLIYEFVIDDQDIADEYKQFINNLDPNEQDDLKISLMKIYSVCEIHFQSRNDIDFFWDRLVEICRLLKLLGDNYMPRANPNTNDPYWSKKSDIL